MPGAFLRAWDYLVHVAHTQSESPVCFRDYERGLGGFTSRWVVFVILEVTLSQLWPAGYFQNWLAIGFGSNTNGRFCLKLLPESVNLEFRK